MQIPSREILSFAEAKNGFRKVKSKINIPVLLSLPSKASLSGAAVRLFREAPCGLLLSRPSCAVCLTGFQAASRVQRFRPECLSELLS